MAITSIAGPYTGSYDGTSLGMMENGYFLEKIDLSEEVRADLHGSEIADLIDMGSDWYIDYVMQEYGAGALKALLAWQVAASASPTLGGRGQPGRTAIGSGRAKSLVLTAIAGTPAASSPATLTASKAIIAPGHAARMLYGPSLRQVPMRQLLLPADYQTANFAVT